MSQLNEILEFNRAFVAERQYEPYRTSKWPDKKLVVLSCMDTRLTELLPRALNLKNGDAKILKTAGALIAHPFGSIMRSLLVAVYELGAVEVLVIGHHGCGMAGLDAQRMLQTMSDHGISPATFATLKGAGVDLEEWLRPVSSIPDSVRLTISNIRQHPLVPKSLAVHGLMMDPETGKLEIVSEMPSQPSFRMSE